MDRFGGSHTPKKAVSQQFQMKKVSEKDHRQSKDQAQTAAKMLFEDFM